MKLTTIDNFSLDLRYLPAGSPEIVIFAHGMTVDKDDETPCLLAEKVLNSKGITTLAFDFRGHGKSSGSPAVDFTVSGELKDLETVVKFAYKEGYKSIYIVGASFGGSIASLYAGGNPEQIHKLFLVNPVLDYRKCFLDPATPWAKQYFFGALTKLETVPYVKIGSRNFPVGKQFFLDMNAYFPDRALQAYLHPLFIVHGDSDTKIPVSHVKEVFALLDNSSKHFEILAGAEHGFDEEPYASTVARMIVDFFV